MAHAVETLTMSIARTSIERHSTPLPRSPSSFSSYAATTWREAVLRAPTSIARSLHLARSLASSSSSFTTRWQGRSRLCTPSSLSFSDKLVKTTETVAMPPYSSITGRERPRSSSVAMAAASCFGPGSLSNAHRLQSVCLSGAVAPSLSSSSAAVAAKAGKAAADMNSSSAVDDGSGDDDDVNPLIVCFGEMLIDFVPTTNGVSLAEAQAFKKAPGGAPANVAVGVARLGGNAAFVGKVGEDEFGHMLVNILEENNVKTQGIRFDEGARTALAFVTLKSNGEREFMFYRNPSADMLLQPEELDKQLLRNASVLHYGSISLISDPSRSAHMAAMEVAKEGGAILSYDPNLRIPLWPSNDAARDGIMSIWNKAQIIKISDDELEFLSEGGDPHDENLVRRFWHDDLQLLLVTRGAGGSSYFTNSASGHVPGVQVSTIDTTGAGDAFVAGLLSQIVVDQSVLTDEEKLRYALQFANTCGAITTTERGAIPALPDREMVLKIMSKTMVE